MLLFLTISEVSCQSVNSSINSTIHVNSYEKCEKKDGYWYKGKCWAHFKEFDDGITKADIDTEVAQQLKEANAFGLTLDGQKHAIDFFFLESDPSVDEMLTVTIFKDKEGDKTLLQTASLKAAEKKSFETQAILFKGNLIEFSDEDQSKIQSYIIATGTAQVRVTNREEATFSTLGTLNGTSDGKEISLEMTGGEVLMGMGDTTLEIRGSEVYLNGTLGTKTYKQFKDLIRHHPEVNTIVLQNVPGSINDAVNMHTGRIIREAGLTTKVLADSNISSGGVDLFCAGKKRIVTKGAQLGIHSWGGEGISAHTLSKDHPAHQYQITYFTMCLGPEKGPDFYFRTLEAAPAEGMHYMSDEEIKNWTVATQFILE